MSKSKNNTLQKLYNVHLGAEIIFSIQNTINSYQKKKKLIRAEFMKLLQQLNYGFIAYCHVIIKKLYVYVYILVVGIDYFFNLD